MESRKFHNAIKKSLLKECVKKCTSTNKCLLDLACGRGGDMHKWSHSGINTVMAVDSDISALTIAKERAASSNLKINIDFVHTDIVSKDFERIVISRLKTLFGYNAFFQFDRITLHFALQYLVGEPEELLRLLKFVVERLKPGGYFVGTCPRKEYIEKLFDGNPEYSSSILDIRRAEKNHIIFDVNLGEQSYFEKFGSSEEGLVDINNFKKQCESLGLETTRVQDFADIGTTHLSGDQKEFSELYTSWIFHKHKNTLYFPIKTGVKISDALIINKEETMITKPHEAARIHRNILNFFKSEECSTKEDGATIVDAMACVGGDSIHFSNYFSNVVCIENNKNTFARLQHNISLYGITNATLYEGSFINYLEQYSSISSVVYLDPPWFTSNNSNIHLEGCSIWDIVNAIITKYKYYCIILKLPRCHMIPSTLTDKVVNIHITNKVKLIIIK